MPEPTRQDLLARIKELEEEKTRRTALTFRVSDKGGVSIYGLGRFPVTLYYEQWDALLGAADKLKTFLEENKHRLTLKGERR